MYKTRNQPQVKKGENTDYIGPEQHDTYKPMSQWGNKKKIINTLGQMAMKTQPHKYMWCCKTNF